MESLNEKSNHIFLEVMFQITFFLFTLFFTGFTL